MKRLGLLAIGFVLGSFSAMAQTELTKNTKTSRKKTPMCIIRGRTGTWMSTTAATATAVVTKKYGATRWGMSLLKKM